MILHSIQLLWHSLRENLAINTVIASFSAFIIWKFYSKINNNKLIVNEKQLKSNCNECKCEANKPKTVRILYGTQTGNSKQLSNKFKSFLSQNLTNNQNDITITLSSLKDYEPEDYMSEDAVNNVVIIILISSYTDGGPPNDSEWFCKWLGESANDFRVQKSTLKGLRFAVFGIGDKAYGQNFCLIAKKIDEWLIKLEAIPIEKTCLSDVSDSTNFEMLFNNWMNKLVNKLSDNSLNCETISDSIDNQNESEEEQEDYGEESDVEEKSDQKLIDIEDIMNNRSKNNVKKDETKKDMITDELRKELTKQGYKLIGSHSGVKLCRWTKSMLRGRGFHSFL
jgi:tRNA wybutosine-synthesizing protein 1